MNHCDYETKRIITKLLEEGCMDINPRPKYADGTPAHTLSYNHDMVTYDLSKGEFPLCTLRPTAIKSGIAEILWIYRDESNDLSKLAEYGVTWWNPWDIGNGTIGACYGETVRRHNLMGNLLEGLINDPDGRRHIISLWQEDDFEDAHGLKPCAFLTQWNVRHAKDGDYLDMCLTQRSSDFLTAGVINQAQYATLLLMVARHTGYKPGKFTWMVNNIQCYDRHIEQAKEMLMRNPIECKPFVEINPEKTDFYDMTLEDFKIVGYPLDEIKKENPQLKFEIGI